MDPWVRKMPWRKAALPTTVFLPGKSHVQSIWWATVHGGCKESDMTEQLTITFLVTTKPKALLPEQEEKSEDTNILRNVLSYLFLAFPLSLSKLQYP